MSNLPKARLENIVVQETETELLIYDLISNKALCLNETSRIVWQACDGKMTFDDFRKKTNLKFSDELIWLALDQLKLDDLLDKSVEIESKFNGLTRREALRKVGFATMIALPMVSSIIAPTPVSAQSGGGAGLFEACSSISCNPGLNCVPGDSLLGNQDVCCVGTVGTAPGRSIQDCENTNSTICSNLAANSCCSGVGVVFPNSIDASCFDCFCN